MISRSARARREGKSRAQFLLFKHYISHARQGAGPRRQRHARIARGGGAGLRAAAGRAIPKRSAGWGASSTRGGPVLRDRAEARKWLELAIEKGRRTPATRPSMLAELLLLSPDRRTPIDSAAWR